MCGNEGCKPPNSIQSYAPHEFKPSAVMLGSMAVCKICSRTATQGNHTIPRSSENKAKGLGATTLTLTLDGDPSPVDDLITSELPAMVQMFRQKARDYQSSGIFTADVLGAKGQFAEMWRKMGKLKAAMWDGKTMVFEDTEEILFDFFGHIMLATGFFRKGKHE